MNDSISRLHPLIIHRFAKAPCTTAHDFKPQLIHLSTTANDIKPQLIQLSTTAHNFKPQHIHLSTTVHIPLLNSTASHTYPQQSTAYIFHSQLHFPIPDYPQVQSTVGYRLVNAITALFFPLILRFLGSALKEDNVLKNTFGIFKYISPSIHLHVHWSISLPRFLELSQPASQGLHLD